MYTGILPIARLQPAQLQYISQAPLTRYNLLSNWLSNRFDNRLYRVYKHSTGCQTRLTTGCTTRFDNRVERTVAVRSTQLSNRFDNRLYRVHRVSECPGSRPKRFAGVCSLYVLLDFFADRLQINIALFRTRIGRRDLSEQLL